MSDRQSEMRPREPVVACHDCGSIHHVIPLPAGEKARCIRCGATLYRSVRDSIGRALGLSLAALFLFAIAQTFPFLTFEMKGLGDTSTLLSGARGLYQQGVWPLAILVFMVATAIPLVKLLASVYVLLPLHLGRRARFGPQIFRLVELCQSLGDDGGLSAGRDRGLREAQRLRHLEARHRALRLRRPHRAR